MNTLEKKFEEWVKSQGLDFLKKGWPDYLVYGKNGIKFIEVKNPHEQLKPHQMRMHRFFKELGLEVKIAFPTNNGFELKESGFVEFDQEDVKIAEGLLNYRRLQDKLRGLGSILEAWAEKHKLAQPKINVKLGRIWMAIARDETKKPYNKPNFYISFSDRLTGSLHVEAGLHFRNVEKVDNFSEKVIETLYNHKKAFTNLIKTNDELKDLVLFLAKGRMYKRVEKFKLFELNEKSIQKLKEIYKRNKDVRLIFAKIYKPEEVIALKDKFSDKIMQTFDSLYKIFDFLKVS